MERLEAKHFKQYSFLSNPVFGNGTDFVFQVSKVCDGDTYSNHIHLGNMKSEAIQLTNGKSDKFLLWDGDDKIIFSSKRDADEAKEGMIIYEISTAGGEARELFKLPFTIGDLIRVDEKTFLTTARVDKDIEDFFKEDEEDDWEAEVNVYEEIPYLSDGVGIVANKRTRLFKLELGEELVITPLTEKHISVSEYRYNKSNDTVYFIGKNFVSVGELQNSLYSYNLKTDEFTVYMDEEMKIKNFELYGEDLILAATDMKSNGVNQNPIIYRYDLSERVLSQVGFTDRSIESAVGTDSSLGSGKTFKVYGDHLYYTSASDYSGYLVKMSLENGEWEFLSSKGNSVTGFDISSSGEMVSTMFVGQDLAEVFTYENEWVKYTDFNGDFHANHMRSVPEHFTFEDANGVEIDGWVMKPVDYEEGVNYPAILHIHGGPKTIFGEIYHHEMQLWANSGYFVMFCNPFGGDGKGNDFADLRGKYGTVDYEDLMMFTDLVLEKYPEIDSERLGVTGGSYGGFMTNWIIGHTDRFKAAATQRSISNWVSKAYMTDIGYYFNVEQVLKEYWKDSTYDAARLWNSSPLKYISNAVTPTLIIHSDEDYRCTAAEGQQLFSALKLAGVETKMCLFKGESHGLSRGGRPKNRLRRLTEILSWMDAYLK